MDFAFYILAAALILAAAIVASALRRPATPVIEPSVPDPRIDTLMAEQGKIAGQFSQTVQNQEALRQTLAETITALNNRLNDTLAQNSNKATETFASIQERLNTIDAAQKNISALSQQVTTLQEILSDKQARGAFGGDRMEAIISDQLTPEHYEFQYTLSNGSRPDCIIRLSKEAGLVVIDSKFPLEAFELLRAAETEDARKLAMTRMRSDVQKHVKDLAGKYIIKGETQTPIIMFVPSESVFSELHFGFPEIMRKAREDKVAIVSPHLLWLAVTTMQAVLRDVKMRENAHTIQKEVGALLDDVRRMSDRVTKLRDHFDQTNKDIGLIETSMRGVDRHAERIAAVDFSDDGQPKLMG
ncbi:MAG TPA: DNA recombination protein RmuC [Rhizomicrobium sp.]|nr:DNA recombination protein RmuC [Rhizomicrobium sp.]